MRFTVIWVPSAIDSLADIWVTASDPQAVTDACNRIDQALAVNPDQRGKPFARDWYYCELPWL